MFSKQFNDLGPNWLHRTPHVHIFGHDNWYLSTFFHHSPIAFHRAIAIIRQNALIHASVTRALGQFDASIILSHLIGLNVYYWMPYPPWMRRYRPGVIMCAEQCIRQYVRHSTCRGGWKGRSVTNCIEMAFGGQQIRYVDSLELLHRVGTDHHSRRVHPQVMEIRSVSPCAP